MKENFLASFPPEKELLKSKLTPSLYDAINANGHIHTPYSFSAFENMASIFEMAINEGINVLGINDFYVTDGFEEFHDGCIGKRIFPLFNVEFIGLMRAEQKEGIRINDPSNPGRIYFSGKGLDYPFHAGEKSRKTLSSVMEETQRQIRSMVDKLNDLISAEYPSLTIDFETVRKRYARELVRERHIARALRETACVNFITDAERVRFLESLYSGERSKAGFDDHAALENEIRSKILKSGGSAFVAEDEDSFLPVENIINIITDAGGIPCYPVLLDDAAGRYTEFEADAEKLHGSLSRLGIGCIELIPGRNDPAILEQFVRFFDGKGFIIIFGTEHNTPEMIPLTVTARGRSVPDRWLKQTSAKGVSVIAAHQYLRARGKTGYLDDNGKPMNSQIEYFEKLGSSVIQYYLSNR